MPAKMKAMKTTRRTILLSATSCLVLASKPRPVQRFCLKAIAAEVLPLTEVRTLPQAVQPGWLVERRTYATAQGVTERLWMFRDGEERIRFWDTNKKGRLAEATSLSIFEVVGEA
jgi:hypothetical protein